MKIIKCLIDSMYTELETAEKYYDKAIKYKDDFPQAALVFNEIASQELAHCEKFHSTAVTLIAKEKSTNQNIPESMKSIWEYEHAKLIKKYDELKYCISKFNI